jgi:hypothetical protein
MVYQLTEVFALTSVNSWATGLRPFVQVCLPQTGDDSVTVKGTFQCGWSLLKKFQIHASDTCEYITASYQKSHGVGVRR